MKYIGKDIQRAHYQSMKIKCCFQIKCRKGFKGLRGLRDLDVGRKKCYDLFIIINNIHG